MRCSRVEAAGVLREFALCPAGFDSPTWQVACGGSAPGGATVQECKHVGELAGWLPAEATHLPWAQGVGSSNLPAPTNGIK